MSKPERFEGLANGAWIASMKLTNGQEERPNEKEKSHG
jgi:hypothetical protein